MSSHASCGCPDTVCSSGRYIGRAEELDMLSIWKCVLTRCYCVQDRDSLTTGAVNGYVAGQIYYDAIMVSLLRIHLLRNPLLT